MYLTEEMALALEQMPLPERYDLCRRASKQTSDPAVRARLLALVIDPRAPEGDYEHLMSCRDRHCLRCAPSVAA